MGAVCFVVVSIGFEKLLSGTVGGVSGYEEDLRT